MRSDPGFSDSWMPLNSKILYSFDPATCNHNVIRRFTIPIGNISREEAEKSLRELISDYRADNFSLTINKNKPEIHRRYSEYDPYGEEIWD